MNRNFRHAPENWSLQTAHKAADKEKIKLTDAHWDLIASLQEYFSKHDGKINMRSLADALDESFHHKGGLTYLHTLFPEGPIAQGCKIAGLKPPPGAVDESFGSTA